MRGVDLKDRQAHLAEQIAEQMGKVQKRAKPWKAILALSLSLLFAVLSGTAHANRDHAHRTTWTVLWLVGAVLFVLFGVSATLGLSGKARQILQYRIGNSHATMVRVVLVLVGWAVILTVALDLFGIPIERLLLGGALTGVLLGIAAQQTLANLFAGIVLLLAKPFEVGEDVRLSSGPMGGVFEGQIIEVGLTYVRIDTDDGITHLPNAQVLSAAVGPRQNGADSARADEQPPGAGGGTGLGDATPIELGGGEDSSRPA